MHVAALTSSRMSAGVPGMSSLEVTLTHKHVSVTSMLLQG